MGIEDFGWKMSIPGVDVWTADIEEQIINSNYPFLKQKDQGSGSLTFTPGGAGDNDVINHDLGYKPIVFVYGQTYDPDSGVLSTRYSRYPFKQASSTGLIFASFDAVVTTTTLTISATTSGSGAAKTVNYIYKIFYDPEV